MATILLPIANHTIGVVMEHLPVQFFILAPMGYYLTLELVDVIGNKMLIVSQKMMQQMVVVKLCYH
jgi:hypothetical protein